MDGAAAVFENSGNPAELTGAVIGMILALGEAAARQWGGSENVGVYVDALLEETLRGGPTAAAVDAELPTVEVSAGTAGPHGPTVWLGEVDATAAAALLAILGEDRPA